MKDYLLELASSQPDRNAKINVMREYLQVYALRAMFEKGHFGNLAFVGGTALRLIHALPRFSEDLDFSLTIEAGYNFHDLLNEIKQSFIGANYEVAIKYKMEKTVHSAFLKFPGLLHAAGLTHRREQNLSIKLDVDTKPPKGANIVRSLVNKYFPITFTNYDLPSLFAGKLHAILTRPYVKGRDYFDLVWILSRWRDIVPNIDLLNEALKQTGHRANVSITNWKGKILRKVETLKWDIVIGEVERFVEDIKYVEVMRPENVKALLQ
jgi:predicted nucleotidyltransferase component of viral defense system